MDDHISDLPISERSGSLGKLSPLQPRSLKPLSSFNQNENGSEDEGEVPTDASIGLAASRPSRPSTAENLILDISGSPRSPLLGRDSFFLNTEERETIDFHKKWKAGSPIWSTAEEAKVFLPRRRNRKLPKLSSEKVPALQDHFMASVERKIANARKEGLLRRVQSFEEVNRKKLPTVKNTRVLRSRSPDYLTRCYEMSELRKTFNADAQSKRDLVMQRKNSMYRKEQSDKAMRYSQRHNNRKRVSVMIRDFEISARKRLLFKDIFSVLFAHKLMMKDALAVTAAGRLVQDKARAHERYEYIKALTKMKQMADCEETKRERKMHLVIVHWVAKFRLRQRHKAAALVIDFLKKSKHSCTHFRQIMLNFNDRIRMIQRNIRAHQQCKKARLVALHLKMNQIEQRLKAEAERHQHKQHSKAFGAWMDASDISSYENTYTAMRHPKHKIDLNLHIRHELKDELLKSYLTWKQKEWIRNVDRQRAQNQHMGFHTVQRMLRDDASVEEVSRQIGGLPKTSFPAFPLYQRTNSKDMVNLLVSAHEAATALTIHKKKLYAAASDVDTANLLHKIDHMIYHHRESKKPTPGYAKSKVSEKKKP